MRIGPLPSLAPREIGGMNFDQMPGLKDALGAAKTGGATGADSIGGAASALTPRAASAIGGGRGPSFSNLLEGAVSEINGKMQTAQTEQAKVLTGESTNLHHAMIAMQESSTAFTMMVEVRNKLVESYQELMRMQV
jgi:flagellar hook-basal body complex protein FliE